MLKVQTLVGKIFQTYQPIFVGANINFNLDLKTTARTSQEKSLRSVIQLYLDFATQNHPGAEIVLSADNQQIIIRDSNFFFPNSSFSQLSADITKLIPNAKLQTRIGFGTTLVLPL